MNKLLALVVLILVPTNVLVCWQQYEINRQQAEINAKQEEINRLQIRINKGMLYDTRDP